MSKSLIQEALERAYSNPANDFLNPDNHDKVNIALGLLAMESDEQTRTTVNELGGKVHGLTYVLSTTIEQQVKKLIESNDETNKVNKRAIRWSKGLTIALILVTLIVGLLQAYVIWKTGDVQNVSIGRAQNI